MTSPGMVLELRDLACEGFGVMKNEELGMIGAGDRCSLVKMYVGPESTFSNL